MAYTNDNTVNVGDPVDIADRKNYRKNRYQQQKLDKPLEEIAFDAYWDKHHHSDRDRKRREGYNGQLFSERENWRRVVAAICKALESES